MNNGDYKHFICGTSSGELIQISPGYLNTNYLFRTPNNLPIDDILILYKDFNFIFLVYGNKIKFFFGQEEIQVLCNIGPINKELVLGPVKTMSVNRFSMYDNNMAILVQYGLLVLDNIQEKSQKIAYQENVIQLDPSTTYAFLRTYFGIFVSQKDSVLFISDNQKTKFSIQLANIKAIYFDDKLNQIIFGSDSKFEMMELETFSQNVMKIAIENDDYDLLLSITSSDQLKVEILQKLSLKLSNDDILKYLFHPNLSFKLIISTFVENPKILITYFLCLIKKNINHLDKIINWTFILYSQQYPEMKDELLDFIQIHYKVFNKELVIQTLNKIVFWEGLKKYLTLLCENELLLKYCVQFQKYDEISSYIFHTKDPKEFIELIFLALKNSNKEQQNKICKAICRRRPFLPNEISPLLIQLPEISQRYLNKFQQDQQIIPLLIYTLCQDKRFEDDIVKNVRNYVIPPLLAFRFCKQYDLKIAGAKILIEMNKISDAIKLAYSKSFEDAKNVIERISDKTKEKIAWETLINLVDSETKRKVIYYLVNKQLFGFEEIIKYADDKDYLLQYKDILLDTANSIINSTPSVHYRTTFPRIQMRETTIKLTSCCSICQCGIIGKKFIIFPCNHIFHSDCLKEKIQKYKDSKYIKESIDYKHSCPICGFLSIPKSVAAFASDD